jgi:hypothetical protein
MVLTVKIISCRAAAETRLKLAAANAVQRSLPLRLPILRNYLGQLSNVSSLAQKDGLLTQCSPSDSRIAFSCLTEYQCPRVCADGKEHGASVDRKRNQS